MREFQLDAVALGTLSGWYYVTYSLFQIPMGICLDLFGARRVLLSSAGVAILGTLLFSLSEDLWMASLGRCLIGAGASCGFLGTIKLASTWFKSTLFAVLVGVTSFVGVIGALVGSAPLALLVESVGWRESMWLMVALGVVVLAALFFGAHDSPQEHSVKSPTGIWKVFSSGQIWLLGFLGLASYSPLTVIADLWGAQFFSTLFQIPLSLAASSSSLLYIGFGVGACCVGWILHFQAHIRKIFFTMPVLLLLMTGILLLSSGVHLGVAALLLFAIGLVSSGECLIFPTACRYAPLAYSGTVTGFVNMFTMLGGSLLQPFVGFVMQQHATPNGSSPLSYTAMDYKMGLSVVLGFLACAALGTFLMRPPKEEAKE